MSPVFFRVSFIVLFCALTALRVYYKLRAGLLRERLYARDEKLGFILFRSVIGVPLLWAVFAYAFIPGGFPWMYTPLPWWLRLIGILFGVGAIALLVWVHQSLGNNFSTSLAPRRAHRMITAGPYAWVRHPMYSAYFTLFVSAFLISENWLAAVTGLSIIAMLMTLRRVYEEALLVERFGEAYRSYRAATGMFAPRLTTILGNGLPSAVGAKNPEERGFRVSAGSDGP